MIKDLLLLVAVLIFLFGTMGSAIYYFSLLFKVAVPSALEIFPSMVLFSLVVICLLSFIRD